MQLFEKKFKTLSCHFHEIWLSLEALPIVSSEPWHPEPNILSRSIIGMKPIWLAERIVVSKWTTM